MARELDSYSSDPSSSLFDRLSQKVDRRGFLGAGFRKTAANVLIPATSLYGRDVEEVQANNREKDVFFAIDTMKHSRDRTEDPEALKTVDKVAEAVAEANATHIAIGTPYDPEAKPMMEASVEAARKQGLLVLFRGNAAGWEEWFNAPGFSDSSQHDVVIYDFISNNSHLFEDGDKFSECPEPENGFIRDPRTPEGDPHRFLSFIVSSYRNARAAFQIEEFRKRGITVENGFFSTNGDVARDIFTPEVVQIIGGKIIVDHYVKDPKKFGQDLDHLHEIFNAKVVVGEWGGPIPDIHGQMSELEQAKLVDGFLLEMADRLDILGGIDYWTLIYGSSSLVNDDFTKREAFKVLSEGYKAMREQFAKSARAN